jgi:H+/Cl- antiporter ClcA
MKKILLPIIILVGVISGLAGITLIRLSKSMEDWEMAWNEQEEEE